MDIKYSLVKFSHVTEDTTKRLKIFEALTRKYKYHQYNKQINKYLESYFVNSVNNTPMRIKAKIRQFFPEATIWVLAIERELISELKTLR